MPSPQSTSIAPPVDVVIASADMFLFPGAGCALLVPRNTTLSKRAGIVVIELFLDDYECDLQKFEQLKLEQPKVGVRLLLF